MLIISEIPGLLPRGSKKYYDLTYTFIEYSTFAFVLAYTISRKSITTLIIILSLAFYSFQIIYTFNIEQKRGIDSIPIGIETILVFVYLLMFFYNYLKTNQNQPIYTSYGFWVSFGIIIYLGSTFFFYILANNLEDSDRDRLWPYSYIPDIIKNILFYIAMITFSKNPINNKNTAAKVPFLDMI